MALDNKKNFAKVTVSTTYDASATSIVLTTGHAARLPSVPFNATWWNATDYSDPSDDPNVEIVRVTAISTDTLTVTRAQESTSTSTKNTAAKTYKMLAGITAKDINTDIPGLKLSAFAATTSAELAGVISDETGSGPLVFGTSPTLTTPVLGAATATSVNGTAIPSGKTLVVTTDTLAVLGATTSAQLASVISDETGSGPLVFATSPSLTTPTLGVAVATSINKMAITAPATSSTLAVADGKTLTASNSLTLAGTDSQTLTFQSTGTVVNRDSTDTLTNKTLTAPTIADHTNATHSHQNAAGGGALTLASAAFANQGTTATVLHGNASGNPSFSAVSLTADVSGTLPVANGGTGLTAVPGSTTQVIYNSSGALAGSAVFVFDGTGLVSIVSAPAANTAPTTGLELKDTTASSTGNQQFSPGLFFEGQGRKTNATAASETDRNRIYLKTVQGAAASTSQLTFGASIAGGAFTDTHYLDSAGALVWTQNGTAAAPLIRFRGNTTNEGFYSSASGSIDIAFSGAQKFRFQDGFFNMAATLYFDLAGNDVSMGRPAQDILRISSGSGSAAGALQCGVVTITKTANYTVSGNESGSVYNNIGASGAVTFTLPTGVKGYQYMFEVDATQTVNVTAPGTDTIRYGTVVSAVGGSISASANGCILYVICTKANTWKIGWLVGAWTGPT